MMLMLLLTELTHLEVRLSAEPDGLKVDAPAGALTDELRRAMVEHKTALLRYVAEYEDEGCEWPSLPATKDSAEEWMITFHQSLAAALEALCPGRSAA